MPKGTPRTPRLKKEKWLLQKPILDQTALSPGKLISIEKGEDIQEAMILKTTSNKLTVAHKWETLEISVEEIVNETVKIDEV